MKKIMTIVGARPQFIKSKALSDIFRKHKFINEMIVHTGQHYDFQMSEVFMRELKLPKPKYFLGINGGSNLIQVSLMLRKLNDVLEDENPDLVMVYGDTNSTLAGALAAKQRRIPLAHVEAGLRSFRMDMAEEVNRVITDRISDLLFVPVREAVENLKNETITGKAYYTGDVLGDILCGHKNLVRIGFQRAVKRYAIKKNNFCFLTLHRAETVDDDSSLKLVLETINGLKQNVLFSMHPRTYKRIREFKLEKLLRNIQCIPPQSYVETLALISNAYAVLTDSGGVQREAYMLKVPCVTLRSETEWKQTLSYGWNQLVDIKASALQKLPFLLNSLERPKKYQYIFGKGDAARKICKKIEDFFQK